MADVLPSDRSFPVGLDVSPARLMTLGLVPKLLGGALVFTVFLGVVTWLGHEKITPSVVTPVVAATTPVLKVQEKVTPVLASLPAPTPVKTVRTFSVPEIEEPIAFGPTQEITSTIPITPVVEPAPIAERPAKTFHGTVNAAPKPAKRRIVIGPTRAPKKVAKPAKPVVVRKAKVKVTRRVTPPKAMLVALPAPVDPFLLGFF